MGDPRSRLDLDSLLGRLEGGLEALRLPDGLAGAFPRGKLQRGLRNIVRRLSEGPGAPLRIALFGPTGAGKSKIFNSLAGSVLSPSGFRRPFTRSTVYWVHEARSGIRRPESSVLALHGDPRFADIVLVDTPDFDSVAADNRREAERVLEEADAFIFVTDVQKYADRGTWDYLDRIHREGKPLLPILNKAVGEEAPRDFFARFEARYGEVRREVEWVVVPELPIDDDAILDRREAPVSRILDTVLQWAGAPAERAARLREELRADLSRFLEVWASARVPLVDFQRGLADLSLALDARARELAEGFEKETAADVSPGLRAEVYARVLERIERLDLLRYPRKILALPFRGIEAFARRWVPGLRKTSEGRAAAEAVGAAADDPGHTGGFQALESRVLALVEESRRSFHGEGRCPGLLDAAALAAVHPGREELLRHHGERARAFQEWLRGEALRTAGALSSEHKVKFFLSQLIYNSAVVTLQVHTAGAFTLAELLTDGVLSPLVAKGVGMALSSETVTRFTRMAGARHADMLREVLEETRLRLEAHLSARGAWKGVLEALDADARELEGRLPGLDALLDGMDPRWAACRARTVATGEEGGPVGSR